MIWIVLIGSILFLYGSFMMVRPSRRQRQTARLREKAIQLKLEVRLASRLKLPQDLSRPDMVCLLLSRSGDAKGKPGSCFKNLETGKIRCYGVFAAKESQVDQIYSELPLGAEALISSESYVGICWDEKGDDESVEMIASKLPSVISLTSIFNSI